MITTPGTEKLPNEYKSENKTLMYIMWEESAEWEHYN